MEGPPGNLLATGQGRSTHVPWPAPDPTTPSATWDQRLASLPLCVRTDAATERAASRVCARYSGGEGGEPEPSQRLSLSACRARAFRPPEGRDGLPPMGHGGWAVPRRPPRCASGSASTVRLGQDRLGGGMVRSLLECSRLFQHIPSVSVLLHPEKTPHITMGACLLPRLSNNPGLEVSHMGLTPGVSPPAASGPRHRSCAPEATGKEHDHGTGSRPPPHRRSRLFCMGGCAQLRMHCPQAHTRGGTRPLGGWVAG